jgi:hypothetical protein
MARMKEQAAQLDQTIKEGVYLLEAGSVVYLSLLLKIGGTLFPLRLDGASSS